MREIEGRVRSKEDGELSALWCKPDTVLAAVGIKVLLHLPRCDQLLIDPSKTAAVPALRRAGQHASLQLWRDRNERLLMDVGKNYDRTDYAYGVHNF